MALRNAFEGLATESLLRRLLEQVRFAKDSSDRMRVTLDGAPQVTVWGGNANSTFGTGVAPYSASSWNVMDARADFQELSQQTFQITRNRWSIT